MKIPNEDRRQEIVKYQNFAKYGLLFAAVFHGIIYWLAHKAVLHAFSPSFGILIINALAFTWVYYDSLFADYKLPVVIGIIVALIPAIGIPIYLLIQRDSGQKMAALVKSVGFMVAMFILYMVGTFLADFIA